MNATPALQTADQLRAVAHLLADAADAYNRRLKSEAANLDSGQIYARLQDEQHLRGIANQMYFEATERTLDQAVDDQTALEQVLSAASAKLAAFQQFAQAVGLMADLLALGGAIVARKPATIIAALQEVRADVAAVA